MALERLSTREDGRFEYRTRKGQVLVFTAAQPVKRLLALIPPQGSHLTRFHGVLAPNAKLRPLVIRPQQPGQAVDAPRVLRTTVSTMERSAEAGLGVAPAAGGCWQWSPLEALRRRCSETSASSRPAPHSR